MKHYSTIYFVYILFIQGSWRSGWNVRDDLHPRFSHNIGSIILCHEEYLRLMGRRGAASSIFGTVAYEMQCLRSSA